MKYGECRVIEIPAGQYPAGSQVLSNWNGRRIDDRRVVVPYVDVALLLGDGVL